ncbi:hypothetical protein [Draconibacterium sp.]|uniref:hypothetical protein n=1 Tax=Draconibacterium sp. TaxID=1965318 RepID=UPI0035661352
MYTVKPIGINIKDSESEVKDGFLRESINLQWREGAFRPVPERLLSAINVTEYTNIILHKVSDEDQVNVLGFRLQNPTFLAYDLAGDLGGVPITNGNLEWFGKIADGEYTPITPVDLGITRTDGMSFTILNGLIYFMGDGSSTAEQYYTRLQFNINSEAYESKDMYAWKSLIPFYPFQAQIAVKAPMLGTTPLLVFSQCGVIAIRYTLVLNSGEEVLHSPIYGFILYGLNRGDATINKDTAVRNIHAFINMDFSFADTSLLADEISAINIYASTPYYESKLTEDYTASVNAHLTDESTIKGEFQKKAEEPFYLIKTIEKPTNEKILLTVGQMDSDINYTETVSSVNIDTIAAGEVMPVDNFSYHKLYGKITSYNGRLIIDKPTTVLSGGHIRALATIDASSDQGFKIDTEDGILNGVSSRIDKAVEFDDLASLWTRTRGLLSYPDGRANYIGANDAINNALRLFKSRRNKSHNMACVFNMKYASFDLISQSNDGTDFTTLTNYNLYITYEDYDILTGINQPLITAKYTSENRNQFSEVGEFSVWPAKNSYRIGEGKIVSTGTNNVNSTNTDLLAPLYIGTTEGLYTVNFDQTGQNLVNSITRLAKVPFVSDEVLEVSGAIVFVSDKGLMLFGNGELVNLTKDFFPDQGNGNFPDLNTILPNYTTLTAPYFGINGNPYTLNDIVAYLKGAKMAYDARRNTIWCSNPEKNFSLIYSFDNRMWGISTLVFSEKTELNGFINDESGSTTIYTRFLVRQKSDYQNKLLILSGEDMDKEVQIHLLTRPIKLNYPDNYKKLRRLIARCELYRDEAATGYFTYGVWGKQDHNRKKTYIPIAAYYDGRSVVFPNNVRQDIPIGRQKGKYKDITILIGGQVLPDSSIKGFEFDALLVDDKIMR